MCSLLLCDVDDDGRGVKYFIEASSIDTGVETTWLTNAELNNLFATLRDQIAIFFDPCCCYVVFL